MSPKTVLVSTPTFGQTAPTARDRLIEAGCDIVELSRDEAADRPTLLDHLGEVDGWVVGYTPIDEEVFAAAPRLAVVAKHGTGVDNIDLDAARRHGVVVANAPGANANAVAELVVLLMLNFGRDLVGADAAVRDRRWDSPLGRELAGKTLGVVGLGRVGRRLVERTSGFDLRYLAYDVEDRPDFRARHDVELVEELVELLGAADFVSLHVPLTEHTRHLIGPAEFEAMGSEACLINTARGGVVDEDALLAALRAEAIGGAALDVLEAEPPAAADRYGALLESDRVTFSPHIGGRTEEAMAAISEVTATNLLAVFEGDDPVHRVV